jgi:hypothetical protein
MVRGVALPFQARLSRGVTPLLSRVPKPLAKSGWTPAQRQVFPSLTQEVQPGHVIWLLAMPADLFITRLEKHRDGNGSN